MSSSHVVPCWSSFWPSVITDVWKHICKLPFELCCGVAWCGGVMLVVVVVLVVFSWSSNRRVYPGGCNLHLIRCSSPSGPDYVQNSTTCIWQKWLHETIHITTEPGAKTYDRDKSRLNFFPQPHNVGTGVWTTSWRAPASSRHPTISVGTGAE